MPELPEVETVCRGLKPIMEGETIADITLFREDLRIPIPTDLQSSFSGTQVNNIARRAKYILIHCDNNHTIIGHLGMSGKMVAYDAKPNHYQKHDHVVFHLNNGKEIIFHDPRRFGLITTTPTAALEEHKLFTHLGYEPLEDSFTAEALYAKLSKKKVPIKNAIMDNRIVVGVGNIYASESLFRAHIHPEKLACNVSVESTKLLTQAIKDVLHAAIISGGSTLRDYVRSSGESGYFQHQFNVYGKQGTSCIICDNTIQQIKQAGRSTYFCPTCQN